MDAQYEEYKKLQQERFLKKRGIRDSHSGDSRPSSGEADVGQMSAAGENAERGEIPTRAAGVDNQSAASSPPVPELAADGREGVERRDEGPLEQCTILSWNLDGLDENFLKLRTDAATAVILKRLPDVIFLQEVVHDSEGWLEAKLKRHYTIVRPTGLERKGCGYYCLILARKATMFVDPQGNTIWFPSSRMGRHLVGTAAAPRLRTSELKVLTSHLESCAESKEERVNQLNYTFSQMQDVVEDDPNGTVVFAGDLNLRDSEVPFADGIFDVWKTLGEPQDCKYTWDCKLNDNKKIQTSRPPRLRFDRMYVAYSPELLVGAGSGQASENAEPSADGTVVPEDKKRGWWLPEKFELVGLGRLESCGMFPSDHFGMLVTFRRTAKEEGVRKFADGLASAQAPKAKRRKRS